MVDVETITDLSSFEHRPPAWFERNMHVEYTTWDVDFEGSPIRAYRFGGDENKEQPGLVLAHGFMAHAHCLTFIAPFLSDRFDVVAYDLSGMGDSPMHPHFEPAMRGRELLAVTEAAGFFDRPAKPFLVAHSQGGHSAMSAIEARPDDFAGLLVCDMMMMRPEIARSYLSHRRGLEGELERPERVPEARPHKVRSDLSSILERYKLAPPQPCHTPFLLEYVARHSIRPVDGGFVWKFDPMIRITDGHPLEWWSAQPPRFAALDLPRAIVYGENSAVFTADSAKYLRELTSGRVPVIEVPDAHHHLMIDQPLAFTSAVRAVLEAWCAAAVS